MKFVFTEFSYVEYSSINVQGALKAILFAHLHLQDLQLEKAKFSEETLHESLLLKFRS